MNEARASGYGAGNGGGDDDTDEDEEAMVSTNERAISTVQS